MKVLITRAQPAASQTAKALAKQGHEAVLLPLFEVIDTGNPIPKSQYEGIIFTSKNAVEILEKRGWNLEEPNTPAFCVGEKTQEAAQKLGFKTTYKANGGGAALVKVMSELKLDGSKMLYLSTPDKSFDMQTALKPHNIEVETIDIYQAKPVTPKNAQIIDAIVAVKDASIFIYSALSSKQLAKTLKSESLESLLSNCTLIGISDVAIKPLEHIDWKRVLIAQNPSEEAMIAQI